MQSLFEKFKKDKLTKLVIRLKRGDQQAANKLYEELFNKVFGFCMNKTSNRATAEDLTQEIFLKLIDRVETFDENRGNFLVWFWQLARNTVTDYYRRKKEVHFSDLEEHQIDKPTDHFLSESLDDKIVIEKIKDFLASISRDEQELFELHFVADLKYKDISKILNKPEASLRVAKSRLKEKIKNNLG